MNDIIEDLIKIYISSIDSYNSKIYQTVNDKYTIIDKAMLTVYLFVKIIEEKEERNEEATEVLSNYLLRQIIYSETGSLSFKIIDEDKKDYYNEILDKLIAEKFEYKNRIMKKLKYDYKNIKQNKYTELLKFLEDIAEYSILDKMLIRGNKEVKPLLDNLENRLIDIYNSMEPKADFYLEKKVLVDLIAEKVFYKEEEGKLMEIALNLRDVYRYSLIPSQIPENDLLHMYTNTIMSLMLAQYCNKKLGENIDIYAIIVKSLFHDFSEYKGTEIVTHFKNYNEITKKMFAEIEEADERDLKDKIGEKLYKIILEYKEGAEGYISELIDKMLGIMKLVVEVGYFHNYTFIKTVNPIFQDRFKRFLRVYDIEELKNKSFYIDLLREYYIYIKENLIEKDVTYFLKYFTEEELLEFRKEISTLKNNPEEFLK